MGSKQMQLGMQFVGGHGAEPGAWLLPGANPSGYTDMDDMVRFAQIAERGKIQFLFFADTPVVDVDLRYQPSTYVTDPIITLAAIARGTERIGLVSTASTTFNEPYNIARTFKALDVMSHGRAGWNAVTTSSPDAAANYGVPIPARAERYERAHEVIQIVEALWGSWGRDAWVRDVDKQMYADESKIVAVELRGKYVASRGPLPIPPSDQGQPVIFQAGGGANGLEIAGQYADGVYANPHTIESARAQRKSLRKAAIRAGRSADDVKMFVGFMPTIAASREAAIARRRRMDEALDLDQRAAYLGVMIGVDLRGADLDSPVPSRARERAVANPADPRSRRALDVVRAGWSIRDVLAHGVIDYHPVVAGTAEDVADRMQEWFEAGACDGFSLAIDALHDGVEDFVDGVVPILQKRGLFHLDYEGATLRANLGAADRYGRDERIA